MIRSLLQGWRRSYAGISPDAWWLSLVILVNRSGSMVLFFMTLYLTAELGYSPQTAGRILSAYGLGAMAGAFLGGYLTDRIGALYVQVLSLVLGGTAHIVLYFMDGPLAIAGMLCLTALLTESFRPANAAALAHVCPPAQRARGFALNRLAVNLGISVGPFAGGILARIDYSLIFWVDGLTCILAAIVLGMLFRPSQLGTPDPAASRGKKGPGALQDSFAIRLFLLIFICGCVFMQIFNTWPVFLAADYGLMEDRIGLLMALNAFLIVLFEMPLIHQLEKRSPLGVISVGAIFLFGGFAMLPLSDTLPFLVFTVAVWTLGEILVFPIAASVVANRANAGNQGQYMGLFTLSFSAAMVVGATAGMFLYEAFGGTFLWIICGGLGSVTTAGFYHLHRAQEG